MLRSISAILWLASAGVACAEPIKMTNVAIQRDVVGGVLKIDTPLGLQIPVHVGSDGLVTGEAGPLATMLGASKDRGHWWLSGDQLCVKWFRWFEARPRCISARREGDRIYWSESGGETGTATLERAVPSLTIGPKEVKRGPVIAHVMLPSALEDPVPSAFPEKSSYPVKPWQFASAALGASMAVAVERTEMPITAAPTATMLSSPKKPAETDETDRGPVSSLIVAPRAKSRPAIGSAEQTFRVAGVAIGDSLKMRRGPSEFHAAVGSIPFNGRGVRLTGACSDDWCPVQHGRVAGWVNGYYLDEDERSKEARGN
jgi:hypothetical protein